MEIYGNKIDKILQADVESFSVRLIFSDGVQGWVSLEKIFSNPIGLAAEVMRGNLFAACFVDTGALAWPNGLEFCPDSVRQWFETQRKGPDFAA